MMWPAAKLRDNRRYIVAMRNLQDKRKNPIQPSVAFKALRDNIKTQDPNIGILYNSSQPHPAIQTYSRLYRVKTNIVRRHLQPIKHSWLPTSFAAISLGLHHRKSNEQCWPIITRSRRRILALASHRPSLLHCLRYRQLQFWHLSPSRRRDASPTLFNFIVTRKPLGFRPQDKPSCLSGLD